MVSGVRKNFDTSIPMGLFADDTYSDVSAVMYSCLATWGKVRAMADNPNARSVYVTFHPSDKGLKPEYRQTKKADYHEDLLDGLYVVHNPFASRPLPRHLFDHPRVAQFFATPEGHLEIVAPDDMLLVRYLFTVNSQGQHDEIAKMFGVDLKNVRRR